MQAVGVRRQRQAQRGEVKYPNRLQFYRQHPVSEMSVEELESMAFDRLQVLRAIEAARVRNSQDEDFSKSIRTAETNHKLQLRQTADEQDKQAERHKDVVSHFVLRLAYCRTEDLRRWFVAQECALFRFRFRDESAEDRAAFMKANNLDVDAISDDEARRMRDKLTAACQVTNFENESFYRVDFERVYELLFSRRVYLENGKAYVASSDLVSILVNILREELNKGLEALRRVLPELEEDERLLPILRDLSNTSSVGDYVSRKGTDAITADQLVQHFPLCMRDMHSHLQADNHLRHNGRIQFGLFLKGLGLNLQESLIYWKRAFAPKLSDDKFNKSYAYNIRYNYGQEGKRVDYAPHDCMRIIMNNPPGAGDHHGCPFKSFDMENLRSTLRALEVQDGSANEIIDLVRNQHYQFACTKYYEATHKASSTQIPPITHPNQYFDLSMGRTPGQAAQAASQGSSQPTVAA